MMMDVKAENLKRKMIDGLDDIITYQNLSENLGKDLNKEIDNAINNFLQLRECFFNYIAELPKKLYNKYKLEKFNFYLGTKDENGNTKSLMLKDLNYSNLKNRVWY